MYRHHEATDRSATSGSLSDRVERPARLAEGIVWVMIFALVSALVIALDAGALAPGEKLTREGGSVETMSMVGYLVVIGAYLRIMGRHSFWAVPMVLLFMAAREFDADKRFTSEGILSTKILFYDTPVREKILALAIWAVLVWTIVSLIRHRGPDLVRALRGGAPWALAFAGGMAVVVFSKAIDGLARKLSPWGIDVSAPVDRNAGILEEFLELGIPALFLLALFLKVATVPRSFPR
ncbi:hypothetical protein [Palleronia sp. LCG004]|uniref:hypothetical protein n=1 Tax=Palleronia sp. LCG004 TaxID=3079304 RepID=UPI00294373CB|nr:hypothetical protein [Palleronia sp. LCG004]WOI56296.1 hypothetical protein RVY76_00435 [Palleronia sp. LCG004]